jgi:pyruvyltransferase
MRTQLRKVKRTLKGYYSKPLSKGHSHSYPTVTLTQWRSGKNVPNFGDDLSSVIVSLLMSKWGRTIEDEAKKPKELLAIGSIIHLALDNAVLWGSGVNGKIPDDFHLYKNLDARAVRGPYTREWLSEKKGIKAPEVYGDPALLLPKLDSGRFKPTKELEHVFVPNLNDMLEGVKFDLPSNTTVISPMQSWHNVVDAIVKAKFVTATSLHGLVIAEAYGIPARYVRLSELENLFKYNDYYAGSGREKFEYATSVHEALEMGGEKSIHFDDDRLLKAFPLDLWT